MAGDARWRRTLVLASAVAFVETAIFTALAPLLPELEREFGLSKAGAGALTAAYALGALAGSLPGVALTRRIGVRGTVLAALAVLGLSSVAFGFAESEWLLFAARFGQGVGCAFAYTGALAWLTEVAPPERRAEAIGVAFAAAFSGALVGPVIGAASDVIGRAGVFLGVAALAAVLAAWTVTVPAPALAGRSLPRAREALRDRTVGLSLWLIALTGLLIGVVSVLAPLRLDELGWSAAAIGGVFAVAAVVQMAANPTLGRSADRLGRAAPLRVALLLAAVTSALLAVSFGAWAYAAVAAAASVAYGLLWTPSMALLADAVERRGFDQALGSGLMNAAWPPGFAVGAAAGGALAGVAGDALPTLLAAATCVLTLPLLARWSGDA